MIVESNFPCIQLGHATPNFVVLWSVVGRPPPQSELPYNIDYAPWRNQLNSDEDIQLNSLSFPIISSFYFRRHRLRV